MKTLPLITLVLIRLLCSSCNQPKSNSKAFILNGKIEGSNTKYLVLSYLDSSNVYVNDTLPVENQFFYKKGYLINTHEVSLSSNLAGRFMEDPNRLQFFLEPTKVDLTLKEGQFANTKIIGSKSQIKKVDLDRKTKPFYDKIKLIAAKRGDLSDKNRDSKSDVIETEIDNLSKDWQKKLNDIKNSRLEYAVDNPQSYVSAAVISNYRSSIPTDSLKMLYNRFNGILKESSYGLKIQEQMNLYIVNTGDEAPVFF